MAPEYRLDNDELVISDGAVERYRGRPDGHPVSQIVPLPDSGDAIVLLKYWADNAPDHFPNLLRIAPDGTIRWRAQPPSRESGAQDAWVGVRWARGRVSANSWSAYLCVIDAETGAIDSATFTK